MPDYKGMYTRLFNKITDAITLLQSAQAEAEELFMEQEAPEIVLLDNPDK